jgi:hypothetical protein
MIAAWLRRREQAKTALATLSLIEKLTEDEGTTITLSGGNLDFNGLPNHVVTVNAEWTQWHDRDYRADTRLLCLVMAWEHKLELEANPPAPEPQVKIDATGDGKGDKGVLLLSQAVVLWLSHRDRINGGFTAEEIANGIDADINKGRFRIGYKNRPVGASSVNAAISGMTIRARGRKWLTDIPPEASVHVRPQEGLQTPWTRRLWRLTPVGISKAKEIKEQHGL